MSEFSGRTTLVARSGPVLAELAAEGADIATEVPPSPLRSP